VPKTAKKYFLQTATFDDAIFGTHKTKNASKSVLFYLPENKK
jgi:hypothetical protein